MPREFNGKGMEPLAPLPQDPGVAPRGATQSSRRDQKDRSSENDSRRGLVPELPVPVTIY
jgi:hypothetical protein